MENFNILSVWWFLFFLLIVSIGYIVVEIVSWEKYPFRKHIRANNNSALDRFIHYVVVWIFSNIIFFIFFYITELLIPFIEIFEDLFDVWESFKKLFGIDTLSFQLIITWVSYYVYVLWILFVFGYIIPNLLYISGVFIVYSYWQIKNSKLKNYILKILSKK